MPKFVILFHRVNPNALQQSDHWDLMLEGPNSHHEPDAGLLTWSLETQPAVDSEIVVIRRPDHRRMYLDYEGPVSRDRGQVQKVMQGEVEWIQCSEGAWKAKLVTQEQSWMMEIKTNSDQRSVVFFSSSTVSGSKS